MKRYLYSTLITLILLSSGLFAATDVFNNVTVPTVWSISGSPYIVRNDIIVQSTLTIEPGVEIKLEKGVELEITGRLLALGKTDSIITFNPMAIDQDIQYWGKLVFRPSASSEPSRMEYCLLQYGGYSGTCPIEFYTKHLPIMYELKLLHNRKNALYINEDIVRYGVKLVNCGVPYTFYDNCYVEQGYDLEIEPGVVLKLPGSFFIRVRGNLIAKGTADLPIIFTGIRDDLADGEDTDNLGPSVGTAGDWGGIILEGSINHGKTGFRNCKFLYGGGSQITNQSFIYFYNSMASIDFCTFSHSAVHGISTFADAMPDLGGGHLNSLGHNRFIGFRKPKYAILNESSFEVPAMYNCWGVHDSLIYTLISEKLGKIRYIPSYNICAIETPFKVVLGKPEFLSVDTMQTYRFFWKRPLFAETYKFQLSNTNDFVNPIYEKSGLKDTSEIYEYLTNNTMYYWRVAAVNFAGQGEWSDVGSFRTRDTNLPEVAIAISPIDTVISDCSATLRWFSVANSDNRYQIQISNFDDYFEIFHDEIVDDTMFVISKLYSNRDYYWRVRALNSAGHGEWSEDTIRFSSKASFKTVSLDYLGEDVAKAFSADVNNDGEFDIIAEMESGGYLLKNEGDNLFTKLPIKDIRNIQQLEFADMNGDGRIDFVILGTDTSGKQILSIFRFAGSEVINIYKFPISDAIQYKSFGINDASNNGRKNIVVKEFYKENTTNRFALVYYANTDGSFVPSLVLPVDSLYINEIPIKSADLDKDGFSDLLLLSDKYLIADRLNRDLLILKSDKDNAFIEIKKTFLESAEKINIETYDDLTDPTVRSIRIFGDSLHYLNINSPVATYANREAVRSQINFDYDNDLSNDFITVLDDKLIISNPYEIEFFENSLFQDLIVFDSKVNILTIKSGVIEIIENNSCKFPINDKVPDHLRTTISGKDVVFEWDLPISKEKKFADLPSFNLRLGSASASIDLISPEADPLTGIPYTSSEGNAEKRLFYIVKDLAPGTYYWSVQAKDGANAFSAFAREQSFTVDSPSQIIPPDFLVAKNIGARYSRLDINPDNLKNYIGSKALDMPIAIGVYKLNGDGFEFNNYCLVESDKSFKLTVWGESSSEKYLFKFYNSKTGEKLPALYTKIDSAIYSSYEPNLHFTMSGFVAPDTLKIATKSGKWKYISSDVQPLDSRLDNILTERIPLLMANDGKIWNFSASKQISDWQSTSPYRVYSNSSDSIKLVGRREDVSTKSFDLNKGWNYLPYPYNFSNRVDSLFDLSKIRMIVNTEGLVFFPEYEINNIGNINKYESVKIYLDSAISDYKLPKEPAYGTVAVPNPPSNFVLEDTETNNMMFLIVENELAEDGDEIGIVAELGKVCGSAVFEANRACITVWGDDRMTTNTFEGALDDEKLNFYYYDKSSGKPFNIKLDSCIGVFSDDIMSPIAYREDFVAFIKLDSTVFSSIDEPNNQELVLFPNPAKDFVQLSIMKFDNPELTIINALGEVEIRLTAEQLSSNKRIDVRSLTSGLYFVKYGNLITKFIKE